MTEEELELRRAHARLSLDENQPRVIDPATGLKGYTHVTLEQQTSILIDKLTIMLAELDALVKQIEIPETASRKMHLILQCLPIYVQRPRQQLRAIANKFPDFACDPSIAVLAFADGALIWVDGALDVARPIAAKDTVPRGEVRTLEQLEFAVGRVFDGFDNIHEVLCGAQVLNDAERSTGKFCSVCCRVAVHRERKSAGEA